MSIAFICAEFGIEESLPIYAGGLGILAGDFVLEAGKQGLDFNAVGLFYNGQSPSPDTAGFELLNLEDLKVWKKSYGTANLFLLDGGEITKQLYGPDDISMLKQQILLGFGAVKLLNFLNIKPDVWHLNEGHTALTALALSVRANHDSPLPTIVATKHTILPGAGLHLEWEVVKKYLEINDDFISKASYKNNPRYFSTTAYLLHMAVRANAVSVTHAEFEKGVHPDSKLFPITNGVSVDRWLSPHPKAENKKILFDHLKNKYGFTLDSRLLTIVWARRLASYKRPGLLFEDLSRLSGIVNNTNYPVQIVFAGKASAAAQKIMDACRRPEFKNKVVFIPEYDISLSKLLVAGADVWLNTPLPGQEASGTSGMKAGLNGALMLSTADGWMTERNWTNIGWILFENNIVQNLYNLIEKNIAPLYYDNKTEWAARMQKTRDIVLTNYTAERMVKDYMEKLYFPGKTIT